MILTPGDSRTEIVESMRRRHAYAATDNILLDFQAEEADGTRHLMGDDFRATSTPRLRAKITGTAPVNSVELIRNNEFIYTQHPQRRDFEFEYTDSSPRKGDNWYYLRVMQQDGNIAWSSPIWITFPR
jgi:hypothetical protein